MKIILEISRKNEDPFIEIPIDHQLNVGDVVYFIEEEMKRIEGHQFLYDDLMGKVNEVEAEVKSRWYHTCYNKLIISATQL